MQKWEYQFTVFSLAGRETDLDEAQTDLNGLGDDGWEVISVMPKMGKNDSWGIALLKRPKSSSS